MATTATLNGGPTGGLHTTPSLIHPENPPQEETCRVDSNSSFESGHDEHMQTIGGGEGVEQGNHNSSTWISNTAGEGDDLLEPTTKSNPSSVYFMDMEMEKASEASSNSKKRRKQSRPVRIPASDLDPSGMPIPPEEGEVLAEKEKGEERPSLRQHHHVPLNLSSRNENSSSEDETLRPPSKNRSSSSNCISFSENDKTDLLAGQGTKDSPHRINTSGSPSLPPSFSPGLFPLNTSSPFSSLFSANLNLFSHHHQHQTTQNQHLANAGNPGPAGTPTSSSSSVGSNSGGGGGVGSGQGLMSGAVSALHNLPPHRIFNPEAYCDLCNKEFCNKYFLKTHKANKHGVYTEMSPSLGIGQVIGAAISANSPSHTSFLTGAAVLSSAGLSTTINTPQQQLHHQQQHQQTNSISCSSASGTGTNTFSKGAGGISSEIPFSLTAFSLEKAAGNSNGSQQRESFCELCQKEFCNKYFLKRHKAKIHGIPIDCSSTGSGRSSSSSNHGKSSRGFSNGMGGEKGLTLRDIGLETLGLEIVAKHLEESGGIMRAGDLGGREEGELSADESNAGMNARESGKSPENLCESDENSSFKMSSLDLKLPQLGNVNAENSCQFCFREFSSKQLLYNHVVKKHRLLIPSTFPPFLLPFPSLFEEQAESAPLLDNNGNTTNPEVDYECNLCNRSFQTVYLLRMHKSYFHPDSEDATDTATSKFISEAAATFLSKPPAGEAQDEEGDNDNETGFNSDRESSGKGSPSLGDDNNKRAKVVKEPMSTAEMEGRGEATSDSDDLRRLQTMIMELNRVSTAAVAWSPPLEGGNMPMTASGSTTICQICNKEFYSSYFLQQHIQHYHSSASQHHGNSAPNNGDQHHSFGVKSESPHSANLRSETPTMPDSIRIKSESYLQSEIGGGGKKSGGDPSNSGINISQETLKERLLHHDAYVSDGGNVGPSSAFLTPGPKGNNNNTINKLDPSSTAKRPSPSLSRSYCTICHKELCNKYFMRTHMLKMHGISIESSTGLGGVTCDICNKELCSKYFLKVHKQNTHGIVEDGPSPPNPSTPGPMPNVSQSASANFSLLAGNSLTGLNLSTTSPSSSDGNGPTSSHFDPSPLSSIPLLPKESGDLQSRYFCHYSEVCPFCGRRFRSPKWLKTHLQSDHGEEGRERWKSIEKTLHLSRRPGHKSSSSKGNFPSGQKGSTPTSVSKTSPLLHKSTGLTRDGNKCAFCNFSSSDVDIMKSHLIKEHGNQLANRQALSEAAAMSSSLQESQSGMLLDPLTMLLQKMEGGSNKLYRCTYCPFTTSILVYLYAHERTHTGLGGSNLTNQLGSGDPSPPSFQCPMCFHAFDQPEAFQQHLIGHQMSGVLAPFFTPTTSSGRLGFLSSPTGSSGDPSPDPRALLSLPLLNGNASDNLYWALKNAPTLTETTNGKRGENVDKSELVDQDQDQEEDQVEDDLNEPAADLTTDARKRRADDEDEDERDCDISSRPRPRKQERVSRFRCSYCQNRFKTKEVCLAHIHQAHSYHSTSGSKQSLNKDLLTQTRFTSSSPRTGTTSRQQNRSRKNFRCRKCKFATSTYQMLVVHSKLQHSVLRPTSHFRPKTISTGTLTTGSGWKVGNLPEGRGIPQEGAIGDGEFLMQGFLLTSSEEENSNQSSGYFVPSLVYLPVREKVSQSIRVSFSLTPTSAKQQL